MSVLQYCSLRPVDTWTLSKRIGANCPQKVALTIAALVTVPLELLARAFYNANLWAYSLATSRSVRPSNEFQLHCSPGLSAAIDAANRAVPPRDGSSATMSAIAFGKAVGDGLGMFTEFLTTEQAQALARNIEFRDRPHFSRPHVDRFPENGWTDDTDQAIMIVRAAAYLDPSKAKETRMAEQLLNWRHHGLNDFSGAANLTFTSRQDPSSLDPNRKAIACQGIGALTYQVLEHPNFIGSMYRSNLKLAVQEAIRYAKVTHADPRCVASAVAVTAAIALLSNGANAIDATRHAEEIATRVLWDEMENIAPHLNASERGQWKEIALRFENQLRTAMHADLPALNLGDEKAMGHTFKCLGAGFYGLRKTLNGTFRDAIQSIIFQGGDADTNAAVAGALAGAYLGVAGIPDSWKNGLHPRDQTVMQETIRTIESIATRTYLH